MQPEFVFVGMERLTREQTSSLVTSINFLFTFIHSHFYESTARLFHTTLVVISEWRNSINGINILMSMKCRKNNIFNMSENSIESNYSASKLPQSSWDTRNIELNCSLEPAKWNTLIWLMKTSKKSFVSRWERKLIKDLSCRVVALNGTAQQTTMTQQHEKYLKQEK